MLLDRFEFLKKAIQKYETRKPYGGKVFKIDLEKGEVEGLSFFKTPDGYYRCSMCCENKKKQFYIHEIIAVKGGLDVVDNTINHIDGDKTNNSIHNLEAVSLKENKAHAKRKGLVARGSSNGNAKLDEETVIKIKRFALKRGTATVKDISDIFGINYWTVSDILKGKSWKHVEVKDEK